MAVTFRHDNGQVDRQQGEFVLTETGVEGSLIYAFSARIRQTIAQHGQATLSWICCPPIRQSRFWPRCLALGATQPVHPLEEPPGLHGLKMGCCSELLDKATLNDSAALAQAIKAYR